jgi:hypothetical protein
MSIPTNDVEEKKKRLEELRVFHASTLEQLGVHPSSFIPKLSYVPPGKTDLYIGMFPSEMSKKLDLYIEFTHKENLPLDQENRTLYKLKYNPFFNEEYEKTEPNAAGNIRYLIPVSELIVVKKYGEEAKKEETAATFELPDTETDLPFNQMTIRDFAAIMLKKEVSHKAWLNKIIKG